MELRDLIRCGRLNQRRTQYLLQNQVIPLGVSHRSPGHGRRRRFTASEAYLLLLAYRLSEGGLPLRTVKATCHLLAGRFEDVKYMAEDNFDPTDRCFQAEYEWELILFRGKFVSVIPAEAWTMETTTAFVNIWTGIYVDMTPSEEDGAALVRIPLCPLVDVLLRDPMIRDAASSSWGPVEEAEEDENQTDIDS